MITFKQYLKKSIFESYQFIFENVLENEKKKWDKAINKDGTTDHHKLELMTKAMVDGPMRNHIASKYHPEVMQGRTVHGVQMYYDRNRQHELTKDGAAPSEQHSPIHHLIDRIATGDPSKDKKHLPQMIEWYRRGQFRDEDLGSHEAHEHTPNWNTVHGTLKAFSDIKNKDKFPDIDNPRQAGQKLKGTSLKSYAHMTFPQFRGYVHQQLGLDKAMGGTFEHPEAPKVFEKDGTTIHHIQSKDAAIHLGKVTGAKWCTGWEGKDNMFHHYEHTGNLYYIHGKDGQHHQVHLESGQFMDKNDEHVPPQKLASKYPELTHFKPFNQFHIEGKNHPASVDYPFKTKEQKQDIADDIVHYRPNPKDWKQNEHFFVAKFGTQDHLKRMSDFFDDHIAKHGHYFNAQHALIHGHVLMRQNKEFGEDVNATSHQPGTPEHLTHLLNRTSRLHHINSAVHDHDYKNDELKRWTELQHSKLDTKFNIHYGHMTTNDHKWNYDDEYPNIRTLASQSYEKWSTRNKVKADTFFADHERRQWVKEFQDKHGHKPE